MRVLIVDDHRMFAESLGHLIGTRDDVDEVAHARSVAEAGSVSDRLRPELAIVDWKLPDGHGGDAIHAIRAATPAVKVIVLTGSSSSTVGRALAAGAEGFLTKDRAADELFDAIDTVVRGEVSLTSEALREVLQLGALPDPETSLSPREVEIVRLLAAGRSNKDIADELFLSPNTVRNHVQRISKRLGAHSRLETVVLAVRAGIIELAAD